MPKHFRRVLIPSLLLGMSLPAFAGTVTLDEAQAIATEFFSTGAVIAPQNVKLELVHTAGSVVAPLYYVFNSSGGDGFVIVSAEDSTNPVLGYSFDGIYPVNALPEAMKWMMTGMERELEIAPSLQDSRTVSDRRRIARRAADGTAETKRLETPSWSQESPFNAMIPGKPLVGCVGTAMASIMKFHQWPEQGTGSFGDVDFNTPYSWSDMRSDNYRNGYSEAEGNAVALLMYHVSKSIDTQYGMSGSSAYEVRVPAALSTYFGYDPGVSYKKRSEVASQEEWDKIVKAEIDAGRPVLYCGQDVTAGHAFVCDGYQGEYLYFNWGWGGSANGYFLSTALNPTVSRTHHYNNLNTIIYNIKPADGVVAAWSPVHITADGNQPGIGSDLTDLASGKEFTVRVGNLKNLSYNDFSGKIAVALTGVNGKVKALLSAQSAFSLPSMATLANGYIDFRNCALPAGTAVGENDMVRIVTLANGESEWLPVAGELPTANELATSIAVPAVFSVNLPAGIAGATVEGEPTVIRGWNYSFDVVPANPAEDVVTVKANGNLLTAVAGNRYTIANVRENQDVTVLVQKAADVKEKRSVWVAAPGTLSSVIPEDETGTIKELTIFGSVDARDFEFMRTAMSLTRLDISGVKIEANGSNQANAIPREAFRGLGSLKEVVLPESVNRLNNGCFRQCGITTITIPAGVKTYEYNVFCGASKLKDIYVGRENAEFINWCVLSGVNTSALTLHVPTERAVTNYSNAENWKDIANIIVDPIVKSGEFLLAVMEDRDVKFDSDFVAGGMVAGGTEVSFTAKHVGDNDNRMDVYANTTLLTPDAEGRYNVKVSANTMIHFDLVAPLEINSYKSQWTLTAKNGSVGLLTDAVNVIPGQEFVVRVNALNIPSGFDQMFWSMALTDAAGNIKEFISPVTIWSAGAGDSFRMNVTCCVKESEVREGNRLRLVTSHNKKAWSLVDGADDSITDALPALNNMTPVYNINVPEVEGATVSGVTATAVRGRDMTIKIVPKNAAHRINMSVNDTQVVSEAASVNYTFVAMSDMNFDIEVFDPKEIGAVTYNVAPGELYKKVTAESVRANVVVVGEIYANDLSLAFTQLFAQNTVKRLDLSGVTILANGSYDANVLPSQMFYKTSGIGQSVPVLEEIILPNSVVRIEEGAFMKCANLKDITLPESLTPVRIQIGTYASGSPKYGYGLGNKTFDGCTSLNTIRIPGAPGNYNGRQVVSHHNPFGNSAEYYNLGHEDPSKVTVVVPEEYLSVYLTPYNDNNYGNPWKSHGYNIVSEYPVYSVNFDPTRVKVADGFDVSRAASFLGDNVTLESITVDGKIMLANPGITCRVFDNGQPVEPAADGSIPVLFYNPAKKSDLSGNHEIKVVYMYDLKFTSTSPLFTISAPEVSNAAGNHFETFDTSDALAPVLKDVAENSTVRFRLDFSSEHAGSGSLNARVMSGQQEIDPDADGYYTVDITTAGKSIDIFAVPVDGAVLNEAEIAALNPSESAAITSIALSGEMSDESFAHAIECFPALEQLDLSEFEGELPEGAFAGMTTLETVVLPEIEEIGKDMFNGCSNLSSVEIPASVNVIGEGAFKDCESLESVKFTGITSMGADVFSGCDNLTTVTLLSDVASADPAGAPRKSVRAVEFHADAFAGMNPNCFVVLDEGVNLPVSSVNCIFTATGTVVELMPDGSTLEREGRIYSAKNPVSITEGYPLAIPHAFTLDEGASVSMEADVNGWKELVVPFDVQSIVNPAGRKVEIVNTDLWNSHSSDCLLYSLKDDADELQESTAVEANVPSLFYSPERGKFTFSASAGKVPATPRDICVTGSAYSLHAVYAPREVVAAETYLLNDYATAFVPVISDNETVTLNPFAVYATSPASVNEILTNLPDTGGMSVIETPAVGIDSGLKVMTEGENLVVYSPDDRDAYLYTADGRVVMIVALHAGRNVVSLPQRGFYLLENYKIIF